ncbi:MAG TPA: NADH-quinone oxidoreductase subunit C [Thermoanaerobaculia bacterium]|nr:NADH-quinone oxidoreductase subunit C [Thermoanaerobaculia bacterium]
MSDFLAAVLADLAELGDAVEPHSEDQLAGGGELVLRVRREAIAEVCAALKERHGFAVLIDLCGVDVPGREPRFEVVYQLLGLEAKRRLRLKVAAGEETPIPSVAGVWRAAEGLEREAWDLFGLRFDGHPDLTRILLWEGFEGHPLRKDFPVEGTGAEAVEGDRVEGDRGE